MTDQRPITWPELMDFQSSVVSRRQALGRGVSRKIIAGKVKAGTWQRLQRGTYATFSGAPPREARLWAAVLRAGPGAVLSHETAAEVHGLIDKPSSRIHITVPASHDPARWGDIPGVVIHRSRNMASQPLPPWQLPRTPIAETVLDLVASSKTFDDAYSWLSRATGRQLATVEMIRAALAARKKMRWRPWLDEALDDLAVFATWTTTTSGTGCASSSTVSPVIPLNRSGETPIATTTTSSTTTSRRRVSVCGT